MQPQHYWTVSRPQILKRVSVVIAAALASCTTYERLLALEILTQALSVGRVKAPVKPRSHKEQPMNDRLHSHAPHLYAVPDRPSVKRGLFFVSVVSVLVMLAVYAALGLAVWYWA